MVCCRVLRVVSTTALLLPQQISVPSQLLQHRVVPHLDRLSEASEADAVRRRHVLPLPAAWAPNTGGGMVMG